MPRVTVGKAGVSEAVGVGGGGGELVNGCEE